MLDGFSDTAKSLYKKMIERGASVSFALEMAREFARRENEKTGRKIYG
jgi:hypothetical protein